jgi:hypothetical protein
MRIIEVQAEKKTLELVVGLIWHPLQSAGSLRSKEILTYAQAADADLKVMRGDDSPHVGFAKKLNGGRSGQLSVAAVIADALAANGHRNVLVAMSLPADHDSYVFVSVRDGVILADGDSVGTRDEIRKRLVGDVAYGGWDFVVCPGDWGVMDAQERKFESFFTPDALRNIQQWQLKDISIAWRKVIVPVVLTVVIAMGSAYGWHLWQKKKTAAADALRLQHEEAARGQKLTPTELVKPWPLMPSVKAFTQACSQAFGQVGLTAGNWALDSVECEGGLLTVRWIKSNESAWVSHLISVRPRAEISNDGMRATISIPAIASPSDDFATTLPRVDGLSLRYYDLASRYGMAVRIDQPLASPALAVLPGQQANRAPAAEPSWRAMHLQIRASFDPLEVASVLDYPGLRFTKIAYAFKDGTIQYQFTGVQYVHP